MKYKLNISYQLLIGLFVFLIPSNLFLKFFESSTYVNGLQIDYLIPKLYLSDLIIFALFSLYIFENKNNLRKKIGFCSKKAFNFVKQNRLLSFLALAVLLRQVNADYPISSFWYLGKILEIMGLIFVLREQRKLITEKLLLISLLTTILFQSSIAIIQFINQGSVYGYLLLGEGKLDKQIGLAKQVFNGVEKILPYGTTAHPNILAGFLSIAVLTVFLLLNSKNLKKYQLIKQPFIFIPLLIGIVALFLTFSWSAWLVITAALFIYLSKNYLHKKYLTISILGIIIIPLTIFILGEFTTATSIIRRNYLNKAAITMLIKNPIWGVGLNNFTAHVEENSQVREVVRFTQPVHHSLLLLSTEIGLVGLITIYLVIRHSLQKIRKDLTHLSLIILILSPIIALDHYLLSNQTGILLIVLLTSLPKNFLDPLQK